MSPHRPPKGAGAAIRWGLTSLRARLLAGVLGAIVLACALLAASAYRGALAEADALLDEQLQQVARSVQQGAPLGLPGLDGAEPDLHIQIWGADGVQLFRSPRSLLPERAVLGFSDVEVEGTRYRVYSIQTPLQTVQIAQDMSARSARARAMAGRAVLPLLLVTPLLLLAVAWVIHRSLASVRRVQRQVAHRQPDDLAPLPEAGLPDEVRPLVDELNALFGRVQAAFAAQRDFVADAAHELRSPLTALRLQAQAVQRASDEARRAQALQRLAEGIERAIALVGQLLLLARQESEAAAPPAPVALLDLTREVLADCLPLAQARGLDLGVARAEPLSVPGQPDALRSLLRNLVDNALQYTPGPGQVDVSLGLGPEGGACWTVEDSGPGIPEAERERAFDRFHRGTHTAGQVGSGLGLAIVQAVARRHGAQVRLGRSASLGGLRVDVAFAPPPPATVAPASAPAPGP